MIRRTVPLLPSAFILLLLFTVLLQLDAQRLVDFTMEDPACGTMIPTVNHNAMASSNESTFRIRILDENGRETFEYDVKHRRILHVKIEGSDFVRAQIQARSVAHPTVQVGSFVDPPPRYFKLVNCSGVYGGAIINEDHVTRRHASARWRPPAIAKGSIVFLASLIRSKKLFHVRSAFLSPKKDTISVSGRNCGRSHGCLRVGDDGCVFGESCRFSIKWRCYKDAMIVDALHSGLSQAFGFANEDGHAVMCVARRRHHVKAKDLFLVGENGFPNIFTARRSRSMKGLRDSQRVFCRFEMERPKANATDFVYGFVDKYGHPYGVRRWKMPMRNMCEPQDIHSSRQTVRPFESLSGAKRSLCDAHFHALIIIIVVVLSLVQV